MGQWVIKVSRENELSVNCWYSLYIFILYAAELAIAHMLLTLWAKTNDSRCNIKLQSHSKVSETCVSSCTTLVWVLRRKSSERRAAEKALKSYSTYAGYL